MTMMESERDYYFRSVLYGSKGHAGGFEEIKKIQ